MDSTLAGPGAAAIRSRSLVEEEEEIRSFVEVGGSRLGHLGCSSRWLRRRRMGIVGVGRGRRRGRVPGRREEGSPGLLLVG